MTISEAFETSSQRPVATATAGYDTNVAVFGSMVFEATSPRTI